MTQVLFRPFTCTEIKSNESSHALMNGKEDKKTAMNM